MPQLDGLVGDEARAPQMAASAPLAMPKKVKLSHPLNALMSSLYRWTSCDSAGASPEVSLR